MLNEILKKKGMLIKKNYIYEFKKEGSSAIKQEKKDKLKVTVDNIEFDADNQSVVYMLSFLALADFEFNTLLKRGYKISEAYNEAYLREIKWKDANNNIQNIDIITLVRVIGNLLHQTEKIIGIKEE